MGLVAAFLLAAASITAVLAALCLTGAWHIVRRSPKRPLQILAGLLLLLGLGCAAGTLWLGSTFWELIHFF